MPAGIVQRTRELARIKALPVRQQVPDATQVTALFTSAAGQQLRPLQAQALFEAWARKGLFGPIRVGGGKTLLSLLLPVALGSQRPLLLVPAKLVEKTRRDQRALLAAGWRVARHVHVLSYEILGRVQAATALEQYRPDLIIADEAHKLRNPKAAVTRRVARWMSQHPDTRFVGLSGTITKRSLRDYGHLLRWALGPTNSPLPNAWPELRDWAATLDARAEQDDPGALVDLLGPEDNGDVRAAYRRRLVSTVGVVASQETPIDASLVLDLFQVEKPSAVLQALADLERTWERPDGWALTDAKDMWRTRRQMQLGFFYRWDPPPPKFWLEARREWAVACRDILSTNRRGLDSAHAVALAIDQGAFPAAAGPLAIWRTTKPLFRPNTVPVWLEGSDGAATYIPQAVRNWLLDLGRPAIVWAEHDAMGQAIGRATGLLVYGEQGRAQGRAYIDDHPPDTSLVAMLGSNSEGRNLQAWCECLVVSPPPNGAQWEQLLGRCHRDGQTADEVRFTILDTDNGEALTRAQNDASYIQATTGQPQKLLLATYT